MEPIRDCACTHRPGLRQSGAFFNILCMKCGRQGETKESAESAIVTWNIDMERRNCAESLAKMRDNALARLGDQAAVLNATVDRCNALEDKNRRLEDEVKEKNALIWSQANKLKESEALHEGAEKAYERQGEHVEQLLDTNEELLKGYKLAGRVEEENQRLKTQVAGMESELIHVRDELKRANQQRRSQAEAEEYASLRAHIDRLASENRYLRIDNDKAVSRLGRMIVACPHDRACVQGGSK